MEAARRLKWTEITARILPADEHDAAQERDEVASPKGGGERSGRERSPSKPTAADVGFSRKEIHKARTIRDAEAADPGIVRRALGIADRSINNPIDSRDPRRAAGRSRGEQPWVWTVYLLILVAAFVGIVVWVFGRKRKAPFEANARPFDEKMESHDDGNRTRSMIR